MDEESQGRAVTRAHVLAAVQGILSRALDDMSRSARTISERSHLQADLGLSSLDLTDIALTLETDLRLAEFPLVDWLKSEAQRCDTDALTVGSLVDACFGLLAHSDSQDAVRPEVPGSRRPQAPNHFGTALVGILLVAATIAATIALSN